MFIQNNINKSIVNQNANAKTNTNTEVKFCQQTMQKFSFKII